MGAIDEDEEVEVVPVVLDRATLRRLAQFARDTGRHPTACASALLRDLLIDDERAHIDPHEQVH